MRMSLFVIHLILLTFILLFLIIIFSGLIKEAFIEVVVNILPIKVISVDNCP
jgi:hypothetical protein